VFVLFVAARASRR